MSWNIAKVDAAFRTTLIRVDAAKYESAMTELAEHRARALADYESLSDDQRRRLETSNAGLAIAGKPALTVAGFLLMELRSR